MASDGDLRMEDISNDGGGKGGPIGGKGAKRIRVDDRGEQRSDLRVYETMPVQWLNAYGQALFDELSDKEVWADMCKPLKSGAKSNSEYCAEEKERHGRVGVERLERVEGRRRARAQHVPKSAAGMHGLGAFGRPIGACDGHRDGI